MGEGRGRAPHDAKAKHVTNSSFLRVKFHSFLISSFSDQSMDSPGSFKPGANKIPQLLHEQLPTFLGHPITSKVVLSKVTICPLIINRFIFLGGGQGGVKGGAKKPVEKVKSVATSLNRITSSDA
jgi:hypothetical protein